MSTTRTTILLEPGLLERIRWFARQHHTSISAVMQHALDHWLSTHDPQQLEQVYQGLKSLEGSLKDPIADASTTIDAVLYGEGGAWRGDDA